jgi:hypothetical protein
VGGAVTGGAPQRARPPPPLPQPRAPFPPSQGMNIDLLRGMCGRRMTDAEPSAPPQPSTGLGGSEPSLPPLPTPAADEADGLTGADGTPVLTPGLVAYLFHVQCLRANLSKVVVAKVRWWGDGLAGLFSTLALACPSAITGAGAVAAPLRRLVTGKGGLGYGPCTTARHCAALRPRVL